MLTYSVEILNPKAVKLLEDLADLDLIAINLRTAVAKQVPLSDGEREEARKRVMQGSPNMNIDAMLEHLRESRQDRKLPFRDDE